MHKRNQGVSDQGLEHLTTVFRLLSDKTRLNILLLLGEGEKNVTALCNELNLPQPTVSHHLGLLRMNNLIVNRRSGKQVFYVLEGQDPAHGPLLQLEVGDLSVQIARGPEFRG